MYEKAFSLEIITPEKIVFHGEVTSLSAPGTLGGFQVLFNHAPMLSSIGVGVLKVKDPAGKDMLYATRGGFVEVRENRAVVLAETAERVDEIDVSRARAALERAKLRLRSTEPGIDIERARAALHRAINRLRLAEKN